MKSSFKVAITISFLGLTLLSSACSPVKPPHKQTFEKFTERRAPRDNMAMANGKFDPSLEKKSGFVPFTGVINVNNPTTTVDEKGKTGGLVIEQNKSEETSSESSKPKKSLLERLLSRVDVSDENEAIKVATNTKNPLQRVSNVSGYGLGQGSAAGQNIYEISDEIIPAQPVAKIEISPMQPVAEKSVMLVAQTKPVTQGVYNPSAPLVEVPEVPSKEEMNSKAAEIQSAPELKNIPEVPEKFKQPAPKQNVSDQKKEELVMPKKIEDTPVEKHENSPAPQKAQNKKEMKPKVKNQVNKEVPAKKKVTAYDFIDVGPTKTENSINDPRARVMSSNGSKVVSGELGKLNQ